MTRYSTCEFYSVPPPNNAGKASNPKRRQYPSEDYVHPKINSEQTAQEEFLKGVARWSDESGAYAHVQRTRPQTAAYGLNDSPAGLAAWILEKFREWSDCSRMVRLRRRSL